MDVAGTRPCAVDDDVAGDPADDGDVRTHVFHEPERSNVDARWDGGALRSEAAGRQRGAPGVIAMAEHVEGVDEQAVQLGRRCVGESVQPGVEVVPRADVLPELRWPGGDDLGDGEPTAHPCYGAIDEAQRRGGAPFIRVDVDELPLENAGVEAAGDEVEAGSHVAHRHEGGMTEKRLEYRLRRGGRPQTGGRVGMPDVVEDRPHEVRIRWVGLGQLAGLDERAADRIVEFHRRDLQQRRRSIAHSDGVEEHVAHRPLRRHAAVRYGARQAAGDQVLHQLEPEDRPAGQRLGGRRHPEDLDEVAGRVAGAAEPWHPLDGCVPEAAHPLEEAGEQRTEVGVIGGGASGGDDGQQPVGLVADAYRRQWAATAHVLHEVGAQLVDHGVGEDRGEQLLAVVAEGRRPEGGMHVAEVVDPVGALDVDQRSRVDAQGGGDGVADGSLFGRSGPPEARVAGRRGRS